MNTPTADEIEAARTPAGGWTREQLAEWGVPWPPPKGWRAALLARDEVDIAREESAAVLTMMIGDPFKGGTTLDFVRHWMMSDDHDPTPWEHEFAAAIDALVADRAKVRS